MPEMKEFHLSLGATLNVGDYSNVRPEVSATFIINEGETPEEAATAAIQKLHGMLVAEAKLLLAGQSDFSRNRALANIGVKPEPIQGVAPSYASGDELDYDADSSGNGIGDDWDGDDAFTEDDGEDGFDEFSPEENLCLTGEDDTDDEDDGNDEDD